MKRNLAVILAASGGTLLVTALAYSSRVKVADLVHGCDCARGVYDLGAVLVVVALLALLVAITLAWWPQKGSRS